MVVTKHKKETIKQTKSKLMVGIEGGNVIQKYLEILKYNMLVQILRLYWLVASLMTIFILFQDLVSVIARVRNSGVREIKSFLFKLMK